MMHGLLLSGVAPLFGRAQELLRLRPLNVGWLKQGLGVASSRAAVEAWSVFGGVPRYWELGASFSSVREAFHHLALDPLGALHAEPERLLFDDLDDATRASTVLALVAGGVHRSSELAGRMGVPVTTLSRPLAKLVDLGLVAREVPHGDSQRDGKRSLYRVVDPFLRTWYRFVEPNRSRLECGDFELVERMISDRWPQHLGETWEELIRSTLPSLSVCGKKWASGQRYWGRNQAGDAVELDLVAPSADGAKEVLVGEVKLSMKDGEIDRALGALTARIERLPVLDGLAVSTALFVLDGPRRSRPDVVTGPQWWRAVQPP